MIRIADKYDLPYLLEMSEQMHGSTAYHNIPFVPAMAEAFLEYIIDGEDYVALIADRDAVPVGAILGCVGNYPFNPALRICDIAFYVKPEARGGTTAVKLLTAYEKEAKNRGCLESYMGVSTGHPTAGALYEKLGYNLVGSLYKKEL